jgi:hypothetical protein
MALLDNAFYVDSAGWTAVTAWATGAAKTAGAIIRQATVSPTLTERCFVCYNSTSGTGTTGASEPTWSTPTRGEQYTDNSVKWEECTGVAALNGDTTNTPTWTQYRTATATATLGQVIQNGAGTLLLLCITGGAMAALGSEPSWAAYTTTGATTADGAAAVWVTLGATNKYSIWNAPQARLANAFASTWGEAGNSFFVSSSHAETQSSAITLTSPGSETAPCFVYCVKNAPGSTPPGPTDVTTGASITTTGNSSLTTGGVCAVNGIQFNVGTGSNPAQFVNAAATNATIWWRLDNCVIAFPETGTGAVLVLGRSSAGATYRNEWYNTSVSFAATGQYITVSDGTFRWQNSVALASGSSVPTNLFNVTGGNTNANYSFIQGVDLSAVTTQIVSGTFSATEIMIFEDCKLASGVVLSGNATAIGAGYIDFIRCDSGGTNYQQERYWYEGTLTVSTAIVRTGGAQVAGTPVSWTLTTTANVQWLHPFESPPACIQNATTGSSCTTTLYGIVNAAAVPNDDQIWLECEYLGASGSPLGSFANNTKSNNLATGAALTADSTSTWSSKATARANSTVYAVGNVISVPGATAGGGLFWCTSIGSSPHESASSQPAGYASAVDGSSVTDGNCTFRAGCRFSMAVTFTPEQEGQINCKVKVAQASTTFYVDPQPVL